MAKLDYTKSECKNAVYLLKGAMLITENDKNRILNLIQSSKILHDE